MSIISTIDFDPPVLVLGPRTREPYVHNWGKTMGLSPAVARIALSATAGPVRLTVDVRDTPPGPPVVEDWETVEDGTIASVVAGLPPLRFSGTRVNELAALERLEQGLYRIRVSVRGRTSTDVDPEALIQVWRVEERDPLHVWKWTDGIDIQAVYSESRQVMIPRRRGHRPPDSSVEARTHSATPPSEVSLQWQRVQSACAVRGGFYFRDTFAPGAGALEVDAAEAQTGVPWPQELKDLYAVQNGFAPGKWSQFFPEHDLLSLPALVRLHREAPSVYEHADLPESLPTEAKRGHDAGTTVGTHLPDFVAFAYRDGKELFCDTRAGDLRGCVTEYAPEEGDSKGPIWLSISAMLSDLADAIETSAPLAGRWIAQVNAGGLIWRLVG